MSQYATVAELASHGLKSDATTGLASGDLDAHLAAASELADSYIASRGYSVPLTTWGADLRAAVARIAAWTIVSSLRGVNPADPGHAALKLSHDSAVAWLRDVAKGVANLNVASTTPARAKTGIARVFSSAGGTGEPRGW